MAAPDRHASNNVLLDQIADVFALSATELAGLFGLRRQALDHWRAHGIPPSRQQKAAAVAAIADLLGHQLKAERIPGIARRPADAYGGLTMLQMIAADRHLELLASVRASFDWSRAA
jgi:hypothetical protein